MTGDETVIPPRLRHNKQPYLLHKYKIPNPDVSAGDGALAAVSRHLLVLLLVDFFVPLPPTYVINGLTDHCYHDDEPLVTRYKVSLECYLPPSYTNLNY